MTLQIGQMLYGYCGGVFGRDSCDNKRIEAIGVDWIVVREEDGNPNFACRAKAIKYLQTDDCTTTILAEEDDE